MRLDYIDNIDCLEGLKGVPDKSVDLIVTDPPYGVDFQSARIKDKERRKPKIKNDKTPYIWWLYDVSRVLKDTAGLLCFTRWDVQEQFINAIKLAGLRMKSEIVWDKGVHGMGDLTAAFAPVHENILFAAMPGFKFPGRRPTTILRHQRVSPSALLHPNEKPVPLIEELITVCTEPGAVVLDPFMGSGTTAVACLKTGRNYIGFELDEKYHAIAMERIARETT